MAYDAKAVANYFLELASEKHISLTPMKLQKLVFFAHGWHLALYSEPLIADAIQAWRFGPVVPAIYHEFKHYGSGAITDLATAFHLERFELVTPKLPDGDVRTRELLNRIWDTYGKLSAVQLSNLTHEPGSPWDQALKAATDDKHVVIDDSAVHQHFAALANKKRTAVNAGT